MSFSLKWGSSNVRCSCILAAWRKYHDLLVSVPSLVFGLEVCFMTKRLRFWIQANEMGFLCRVSGLSLRDKGKGSVNWKELGVEILLPHIKRNQLRRFRKLIRMPSGCFHLEVVQAHLTGRRPGKPRHSWRSYFPSGLGMPWDPPWRNWSQGDVCLGWKKIDR